MHRLCEIKKHRLFRVITFSTKYDNNAFACHCHYCVGSTFFLQKPVYLWHTNEIRNKDEWKTKHFMFKTNFWEIGLFSPKITRIHRCRMQSKERPPIVFEIIYGRYLLSVDMKRWPKKSAQLPIKIECRNEQLYFDTGSIVIMGFRCTCKMVFLGATLCKLLKIGCPRA